MNGNKGTNKHKWKNDLLSLTILVTKDLISMRKEYVIKICHRNFSDKNFDS